MLLFFESVFTPFNDADIQILLIDNINTYKTQETQLKKTVFEKDDIFLYNVLQMFPLPLNANLDSLLEIDDDFLTQIFIVIF